jgi:methyl-accepting chemotaxis protein
MSKKMKIQKMLVFALLITTTLAGIGTVIGLIAMNHITSRYQALLGSQAAQELARQNMLFSVLMPIFPVLALVLVFVFSAGIKRTVTLPLQELSEAAKKMSEGNLNTEVAVESQNEIGELAAAFNKTASVLKAYITDISATLAQIAQGDMDVRLHQDFKGDFEELRASIRGITVSFSDALMQIGQTADQVSAGSVQVSDGAQALAQGATEQASSVQELTATIEDISSHTKENATHATAASQNVARVETEIESSNQYMEEMIAAMKQIDESSAQIGKIIKTIEDIAFQTNILALNAAVEAARAGEAGKGFAVVAGEVRNLASKSALAAKDTTSLIENSLLQVKSGTKIAAKTAEALTHVVESARAVTETVDRISSASKRQSDAILQVTQGIEQISAVVQNNSATAEQSAAASEELSAQAQNLDKLLQRFNLRGSDRSGAFSQANSTETTSAPAMPVFSETGFPKGTAALPDRMAFAGSKY